MRLLQRATTPTLGCMGGAAVADAPIILAVLLLIARTKARPAGDSFWAFLAFSDAQLGPDTECFSGLCEYGEEYEIGS